MKRTTLRHPKIMDLMCRLQIDRPTAIGLLTLLWDFAADYAIGGNIGKHTDGVICGACEWKGDPEVLINAFVASGWLDRCEHHRLVIHDWYDHCEQWVKNRAIKLKIDFVIANSKTPQKPSPPLTSRALIAIDSRTASDDFEMFWSLYPAQRRMSKPAAERAWAKAVTNVESLQAILDAVKEYAASPLGKGDFCLSAANFLNNKAWLDDRRAWQISGTSFAKTAPQAPRNRPTADDIFKQNGGPANEPK